MQPTPVARKIRGQSSRTGLYAHIERPCSGRALDEQTRSSSIAKDEVDEWFGKAGSPPALPVGETRQPSSLAKTSTKAGAKLRITIPSRSKGPARQESPRDSGADIEDETRKSMKHFAAVTLIGEDNTCSMSQALEPVGPQPVALCLPDPLSATSSNTTSNTTSTTSTTVPAKSESSVSELSPVGDKRGEADGEFGCTVRVSVESADSPKHKPSTASPDPESTVLLAWRHTSHKHRASLPAVSTTNSIAVLQRRGSAVPDPQRADSRGLLTAFQRSSTLETDKIKHHESDTEETVNQYRLLEEIGKGSYGLVWAAEATSAGEKYAIKLLSKSRLTRISKKLTFSRGGKSLGNPKANPKTPAVVDPLRQVKREIAILKSLDHPNVINLREVMDDPEEDYIYMVFELMPSGSAMDDDLKPAFDEKTAKSYFIDLMLGVEYLHAQNIAHRDIKPQNLLLDDSRQHIKITDFGVSEWLKDDYGSVASEGDAGSPAFMAPEMFSIRNRGERTELDAKKCDIWAMGITLYCFLFGELPFRHGSIIELHRLIKEETPEFPESVPVSEQCCDLILRTLEKNAEERMSIAEMRSHGWLEDVLLPSVEENCTGVNELTEEEVASAFSAMSVTEMECLIALVQRRSQHSPHVQYSLRTKEHSVSVDETDSSALNTRSSSTSLLQVPASGGGICESLELSEEQERILEKLAHSRRPSFSPSLWSTSSHRGAPEADATSPLLAKSVPGKADTARSPTSTLADSVSMTSCSPTAAVTPVYASSPEQLCDVDSLTLRIGDIIRACDRIDRPSDSPAMPSESESARSPSLSPDAMSPDSRHHRRRSRLHRSIGDVELTPMADGPRAHRDGGQAVTTACPLPIRDWQLETKRSTSTEADDHTPKSGQAGDQDGDCNRTVCVSNCLCANPDVANPDVANPDVANPDVANPDVGKGEDSTGTTAQSSASRPAGKRERCSSPGHISSGLLGSSNYVVNHFLAWLNGESVV